MERVLIDTFIVPEESKAEFLERARKSQSFISTLPGFVEGFLYEKKDGENRYNFLTTAVWENEEAFENAKKAVAIEYQKQGFNPQETRKKLKIESVRSTYPFVRPTSDGGIGQPIGFSVVLARNVRYGEFK
jgi:heme-degrading monooxygenase HmoA